LFPNCSICFCLRRIRFALSVRSFICGKLGLWWRYVANKSAQWSWESTLGSQEACTHALSSSSSSSAQPQKGKRLCHQFASYFVFNSIWIKLSWIWILFNVFNPNLGISIKFNVWAIQFDSIQVACNAMSFNIFHLKWNLIIHKIKIIKKNHFNIITNIVVKHSKKIGSVFGGHLISINFPPRENGRDIMPTPQ
jgi:hypothetical protein